MATISKKRKHEAGRTTFYSESTGRAIGYIDVELSSDDWNQLHALFEIIYSAGLREGSATRAEEIRIALGLQVEKEDG